MRHQKRGRKLNRTSSHRKALMRNMATSLFEHKKIETTEAKAKELRPYAEQLITRAKHALINEKAGNLPEGHTIDIHNRRMVGKVVRTKAVLQELFDVIGPMVEERNGGYTRIVKSGFRRGDAGQRAIIELVDFAAPQDGASSMTGKKKKTKKVQTKPVVKEEVIEEVVEAPVEEVVEAPVEEVVDAPVEKVAEAPVEEVAETPAEEAPAEEAPADEVKTDDDKKDKDAE
ncbi:MAG: 50S ribosomal protein L17 [Candidatus Kapabacteria bacterium]|jgi:large subunit ribosomal protein L17|nr:50S ribosomal protein L17 [Candidatus Kapabacteria bacterium]